MNGSRIKNLWNTNGRAPDSRDEWDYTGLGLRVGRIDIPASAMVVTDGYSKVEYKCTMGDGSVQTFANFEAVIDYMDGSIESVAGSGYMTVFLNDSDVSQLGYHSIDVYKEWETADPEPEPVSVDDLTDISGRGLGLVKHPEAFGIGGYASRINWDEAATRGLTMFISDSRGAPGSSGLNVMGVSIAHTSGYTFQIGGRNGQIWTRFQEKGELSEWAPFGGTAFNPKPLEDKIADLEKRIAALEAATK